MITSSRPVNISIDKQASLHCLSLSIHNCNISIWNWKGAGNFKLKMYLNLTSACSYLAVFTALDFVSHMMQDGHVSAFITEIYQKVKTWEN